MCPCVYTCASGTVGACGVHMPMGLRTSLEASAGGAGCYGHVSCALPGTEWLHTQAGSMDCLFPTPPWGIYGSALQDNLSSPNHSLLPPDLLLNVSHSAFLPLGLKVTIVGLYLAVCVGGLLGNCLVMYVILR